MVVENAIREDNPRITDSLFRSEVEAIQFLSFGIVNEQVLSPFILQ